MIEALLDRSLLARMISEAGPALEWETFLPDDWHLVVREAQAQGVAPLLHWKLARSGKIVLAPRQAQDLLRGSRRG